MKKKLWRFGWGVAGWFFAATIGAQGATQEVNGFRVEGNSLLPPESIERALAPYKGTRSVDELQRAAQDVQALYSRHGYGAVVVGIAPELQAGVALVKVIEARIGNVTLSGNAQFSNENVRRTMPALREGQTPQVRALNTQIELANQNPARKIGVSLERGRQPGTVDAQVLVSEKSTTALFAAVDNTGTQQTGRARFTLGLRQADLWGLDHQASAQVQTSDKPSSVAIVTGTYMVPFYEQAMRLDAFAARSNVDGGTMPTQAGAVTFNGRGNVAGVQVTKLLDRRGELDQRLRVGVDLRQYLNQCSVEGLGPGACGRSGESVTVHPLTLDYSLQTDDDLRAAGNVAVSRNMGLGGRHGDAADVSAVRAGAAYRYTTLRMNGRVQRAVGDKLRLVARLSAQFTGDALIPGEQFGLAGSANVRGYEEREVVGDQGLLASVELVGPNLLGQPGGVSSLRVAAFVDAGRVTSRPGHECILGRRACSLAAMGLGVRWATSSWQLSVDLARAAEHGATTRRGDTRLHLSASYSLD